MIIPDVRDGVGITRPSLSCHSARGPTAYPVGCAKRSVRTVECRATRVLRGTRAHGGTTSVPCTAAHQPPLRTLRDAQPVNRVDRRNVEQAQLEPLVALPTVDRERAGNVHAAAAVLEKGVAEFLAGGAEGDGVERAPSPAAEPRAHMGWPTSSA